MIEVGAGDNIDARDTSQVDLEMRLSVWSELKVHFAEDADEDLEPIITPESRACRVLTTQEYDDHAYQ